MIAADSDARRARRSTGSRSPRCWSCSAAALVLLVVGALHAAWPRHAVRACSPPPRRSAAMILCFFLWDDITDDGADARWSATHCASTSSRCSSRSRSASAVVLVALVTDDYLRREDLDGPEVYAPVPAGRDRRHRDGLGQRPDRAVPRSRDPVDRAVRAGRQPSQAHREPGERHQVLRARWLLVGVLPVRHRAGLRRRRQHQLQRDRRRRSTPTCRPIANDAFILAGVALLLVGLGVQGRRRAVPLLDARRVPGRAHAGDGVHGVGRQGRSVRRDAARAGRRPAALARRLAPGHLGARRADAGRRLGDGGRADQRQAHAGVLVDQPRRLHPHRRRGRRAPRRRRRRGQRHAVGAAVPAAVLGAGRSARSPSSRMVGRTGDGATDLVVVPRPRQAAAGAGAGA